MVDVRSLENINRVFPLNPFPPSEDATKAMEKLTKGGAIAVRVLCILWWAEGWGRAELRSVHHHDERLS